MLDQAHQYTIAHHRRFAIVTALAFAVPVVLVTGFVDRHSVWLAVGLPLMVGMGIWIAVITVPIRNRSRWTARAHRRVPELEYSLELVDYQGNAALAALQSGRIRRRVGHLIERGALGPFLLPAWAPTNSQSLLLGTGLAAAIFAVHALVGPELSIRVQPPAYLERPPWAQASADLVVPEGSTVTWRWSATRGRTLRLFIEQDPIAPSSDAQGWYFEHAPRQSQLYSITLDEVTVRHSIEVTPDRPPAIDVLAPREAVAFAPDASPALTIDFKADDDNGLTRLTALVTLARGTGESVRFRDREIEIPIQPGDDPYRLQLDPSDFELAPGDELYVRLEGRDNRPQAQTARSETVIFRWLRDDASAQAGIAALVVDRMPEYFRSQRQIIIDTEALLAEIGALPQAAILRRSQSIAADQRALRLRYGQYLGEEGSTEIGVETTHDHGAEATAFGVTEDHNQALLEPFVHAHDSFLEATMFDEATRSTLVTALNAMWKAEMELGLGEPTNAVPYENEALVNLKRVQQSARIYVQRVGFEPPPLDEERRHTGELDEAIDTLAVREAPDERVDADRLLARLLQGEREEALESLAAFARDERHSIDLRDAALELISQPCRSCRKQLTSYLWDAEPVPVVVPRPRQAN